MRCRRVTSCQIAFQEVARAWLLLAEQVEWMDRQQETERAMRPADRLGNLPRAGMLLGAKRSVLLRLQLMSVPEAPPLELHERSGGVLVYAVPESRSEPTMRRLRARMHQLGVCWRPPHASIRARRARSRSSDDFCAARDIFLPAGPSTHEAAGVHLLSGPAAAWPVGRVRN